MLGRRLRGWIPLLVLPWPCYSSTQFSLSEFNQGERKLSIHWNQMYCRKSGLGRPRRPSSCICHPRRLEAVVRCRMQVAHHFHLPSWFKVQRDLIWCAALAEKNMCELEGEAMLNECRSFYIAFIEIPTFLDPRPFSILLKGNLPESLLWSTFSPPSRCFTRIWWAK